MKKLKSRSTNCFHLKDHSTVFCTIKAEKKYDFDNLSFYFFLFLPVSGSKTNKSGSRKHFQIQPDRDSQPFYKRVILLQS